MSLSKLYEMRNEYKESLKRVYAKCVYGEVMKQKAAGFGADN
jgi:hypothetical protein